MKKQPQSDSVREQGNMNHAALWCYRHFQVDIGKTISLAQHRTKPLYQSHFRRRRGQVIIVISRVNKPSKLWSKVSHANREAIDLRLVKQYFIVEQITRPYSK